MQLTVLTVCIVSLSSFVSHCARTTEVDKREHGREFVGQQQQLQSNYITDSVPTYQAACVADFFYSQYGYDPLVTVEKFRQCVTTVSMDAEKAIAMHSAAKTAIEFYSFRDENGLYKLTTDRVNSLLTDILDVNTRTWKRFVSEFEFSHRLASTFRIARDQHLVYSPPTVFSRTFTTRLFNVYSRLNATSGKQELYVGDWSSTWKLLTGRLSSQRDDIGIPSAWNLTKFIEQVEAAIDTEATIVSINGLDPVGEWFPSIESSFGYLDPGANMNSALEYNFDMIAAFTPPHWYGFTHQGDVYPCSSSGLGSKKCDTDTIFEEVILSNGMVIEGLKLFQLSNRMSGSEQCAFIEEVALDKGVQVFSSGVRVGVTEAPAKDWQAMSQYPTAAPKSPASAPSSHRRRASGAAGSISSEAKTIPIHDVVDGKIKTYVSSSGGAAVITVSGFPQLTHSASVFTEFTRAMNAFVLIAAGLNVTSLTIDLTGNPGGYIQTMDLLLKILFRKQFYAHYQQTTVVTRFGVNTSTLVYPESDHRSFATMAAYVAREMISKNATRGGDETLFKDIGPAWFAQILNQTFNGTAGLLPMYSIDEIYELEKALDAGDDAKAKYLDPWWYQHRSYTKDFRTPLFHHSSPFFFDQPDEELNSDQYNPFKNITILSDGTCGSACSMMESRIAAFFPSNETNVTTITFGGWKHNDAPPMEVSGFCGGAVVTLSCVAGSNNISYPFPGELESRFESTYYPVDFATNVLEFYTDPRIDLASNRPRQLQSRKGDQHWWAWEPTLEEKVLFIYPEARFWKVNSTTSGASAVVHTQLLHIFFSVVVTTLLVVLFA